MIQAAGEDINQYLLFNIKHYGSDSPVTFSR